MSEGAGDYVSEHIWWDEQVNENSEWKGFTLWYLTSRGRQNKGRKSEHLIAIIPYKNQREGALSYLSSGFSLSVTDVVAAGRLSPDAPEVDDKAADAVGALQI